jgi:hypothetical protein
MRHLLLLTIFFAGGCASSYTTPGRGATMEMFGATPQAQKVNTDGGIQSILDKKPLASFPASIAVVRVQAPGYRSYTACGIGGGRFSVITTRDIEADADVARLSQLPMMRGVAPLNRLVLPDAFQSDYELREAAAKMHADMVLVYTLDTQFVDLNRSTPLTVFTLGIATTKNMRILTTASAALLDTRSGYIYGLAEGTERHEEHQNAWKTDDEVDMARRKVETEAFKELVDNLQTTWSGVVAQYATPAQASGGVRYRTDQ